MAELAPLNPRDPGAPLRELEVLEIEGELTGYAGKLLADLGANVVLAELAPPTSEGGGFDPRALFLHRHKTRVRVGGDSGQLERMIRRADVILQSGGKDAVTPPELEPAAVRARNPAAVHAILTPFGLSGPKAGLPSTDLTRLAAGGLLSLGGYPDTEPIAAFGDQSTVATGIYAAVGVLFALLVREQTGVGDTVEISAQEVVTQALETSLAEFELLGTVRRRLGDMPREAGTGIFPCADGYISMVAGRLGTAAAWKQLVGWLEESGTPGAQTLGEPGWETLAHRQRPEAIAEFSKIFGRFTATRSKQDIYREGQRRGIAVAAVNSVSEVLADPQLAAREFFVAASDPGSGTWALIPAPPFRLSPPTASAAAPQVAASAVVKGGE
jgi:benzylsuccinate CoA-transferase BbsE subunit